MPTDLQSENLVRSRRTLENQSPHVDSTMADHELWRTLLRARYRRVVIAEVNRGFTPKFLLRVISSSKHSLTGGNTFGKEVLEMCDLIIPEKKTKSKVRKSWEQSDCFSNVSRLADETHFPGIIFKDTDSAAAVKTTISNTIANPKGELKAITTRSGLVLDGPSVPMPLPFINPEEDERVEETLTDPELAEYTIKVPPLLV
ncbi:hypothetical protein Tco_0353414 [Tanacetum coccineum]